MSIDAFILALRMMFDPCAADGLRASYELRFGDESFRAVMVEDRFEIARGSAKESEATIETDVGTLAALVFEGRRLDEALRSGDLKFEGDESVVARFFALFPLLEPAEPATYA